MPVLVTSGAAQEVLPRNKYRASFIIQNEDAAIMMYIKRERGNTVSSTDHDHRLGPGAALALNLANDGLPSIQERYTIIPASGTPTCSYFETELVER